jgi:hypothetical protein
MDVSFYVTPGPMTRLPAGVPVPESNAAMRDATRNVLVHRDWVPAYGLADADKRLHEQHLHTAIEVLATASELDDRPITEDRPATHKVQGICRHFALLHTAMLRATGVPARVRCGFASYFAADDRWYDHWITEWWDGSRWVRDDPQVDDVQRAVCTIDFDVNDQPPGRFVTGAEAWQLVRSGEVDGTKFGIGDMWSSTFVAGNVVLDLACLNKVETLPWDSWGLLLEGSPYAPVAPHQARVVDEIVPMILADDTDGVRERYQHDDRLRVPSDLLSFVDGAPVPIHLELD